MRAGACIDASHGRVAAGFTLPNWNLHILLAIRFQDLICSNFIACNGDLELPPRIDGVFAV